MTIMEMPRILLQILMVWHVLLIIAGMMLFLWQVILRRRVGIIVLSLAAVAVSQVLYLPLRAVEQYHDKGRGFAPWLEQFYSFSVVLFLLLTIAISVWEILLVKNSFGWRASHLSSTSVYESFQKLPIGICCYQDGGMTRLVNAKMNRIARELFGCGIANGEWFAEQLRDLAAGDGRVVFEQDLEVSNGADTGEKLVLKTNQNTVYSFSFTDIPYRNTVLHEILATDVTQEYLNLIELHQDKKHMQEINDRLRAYSKSVIDVNIEKEILEAKTRIHDELGHALIVSKRYLKSGEGDREEILKLWRKNIALLKDEHEEQPAEDYETMFYIAQCAGVEIVVDGELPKAPQVAKQIAVKAISECLTNVCRHTHGNRIVIKVAETSAQEITLCFTNNGEAPTEEIKEGGGLTNLRNIVEGEGGRMHIQSMPEYQLELVIPKGEESNE